jgi:hypothetical protein
MIPAAGQGALGIEVREDATALRAHAGQTGHTPTWLAVHAERAVSRALGGSCSMPLAAHAVWEGEHAALDAALGDAAEPTRPLLRTQLRAAVADEAEATALGARPRRSCAPRRRSLPAAASLRLPAPQPIAHARHRHPAGRQAALGGELRALGSMRWRCR